MPRERRICSICSRCTSFAEARRSSKIDDARTDARCAPASVRVLLRNATAAAVAASEGSSGTWGVSGKR
jgi:hypothetical protein